MADVVYDGFLGYSSEMPDSVSKVKPIEGTAMDYNRPPKETDIPKKDMVNHPPHYQSKSGMEVIDVIDAFTSDLSGRECNYTSHILRYTLRWKQKNGLEDLKKARWYLNRLIDFKEKGEQK